MESVVRNDYPKDKLEIIVINGMSEDNTSNLAKEYSLNYKYINVIENIDKITPCSLNKGIKRARGNVIVRMDVHSEYPKEFLSNGIKYLNLTKADVVGGPIITKPASERLVARAISEVTSHKFGVGNSSFRTGKVDGYVDTVPFGFFRKTVFDKVGLFDERLVRNPDLAREMGRNGRSAFRARYNWTSEEEKLVSLYRNLLNLPSPEAPSPQNQQC